MVRPRRAALAVGVLAICSAAVMSISGPAAAGPVIDDSTYLIYGVSPDAQPVTTGTATQARLHPGVSVDSRELARTGSTSLSDGATPGGATTGLRLVHPMNVASGYVMLKTDKLDDYHYTSDTRSTWVEKCHTVDGSCTRIAQVNMYVKESVRGKTSKYWDLTEVAQSIRSSPGVTYFLTAVYYCAVNIANTADHYCGNGADASGIEAPMTPAETVAKKFENVSGNIVYPMVGIRVHWNTGVVATGKYREFDTCNQVSATRLCDRSGTGT